MAVPLVVALAWQARRVGRGLSDLGRVGVIALVMGCGTMLELCVPYTVTSFERVVPRVGCEQDHAMPRILSYCGRLLPR